jgi:hypothetical protein
MGEKPTRPGRSVHVGKPNPSSAVRKPRRKIGVTGNMSGVDVRPLKEIVDPDGLEDFLKFIQRNDIEELDINL